MKLDGAIGGEYTPGGVIGGSYAPNGVTGEGKA